MGRVSASRTGTILSPVHVLASARDAFLHGGTCTSSAFQRNKAALQTANNTPFCVFLWFFSRALDPPRDNGVSRKTGRERTRGDKWHRI